MVHCTVFFFFFFWPDFQVLWLTMIRMFMSSILKLNRQDVKDFRNPDSTWFLFFHETFDFLFMRNILYNFILNDKVLKHTNFLGLPTLLIKQIIIFLQMHRLYLSFSLKRATKKKFYQKVLLLRKLYGNSRSNNN